MLNSASQATATFTLEQAERDRSFAGEQNQKFAAESRAIYDVFYDNLFYFSAGVFSFSIALIGFVVDENTISLSKAGFLMPNIFWLYSSLSLYLVTGALILISRRADAAYVGAFGMASYTEKCKVEQEARKAFFETTGRSVIIPGSDVNSEIATCVSNIAKINKAHPTNQKNRDFNFSLKRYCHILAEGTVVVATLLFFLFCIQLMQALVWP